MVRRQRSGSGPGRFTFAPAPESKHRLSLERGKQVIGEESGRRSPSSSPGPCPRRAYGSAAARPPRRPTTIFVATPPATPSSPQSPIALPLKSPATRPRRRRRRHVLVLPLARVKRWSEREERHGPYKAHVVAVDGSAASASLPSLGGRNGVCHRRRPTAYPPGGDTAPSRRLYGSPCPDTLSGM